MTHLGNNFLQPFSQAFFFLSPNTSIASYAPFLGSLSHFTSASQPQICDTGLLFHTERDHMGTTYTRLPYSGHLF
jgi:hypothetical protein